LFHKADIGSGNHVAVNRFHFHEINALRKFDQGEVILIHSLRCFLCYAHINLAEHVEHFKLHIACNGCRKLSVYKCAGRVRINRYARHIGYKHNFRITEPTVKINLPETVVIYSRERLRVVESVIQIHR
jgi:hypothetical protein